MTAASQEMTAARKRNKKLLSSEDAAIALLLQQMPAPRDQHGPKDKDDDRIWLNCAASPPTMCRCMLSTT